jgi:cellulose synthase/poly-beta-1,6-N-acetylglucosamine synthase-like glycosyltransferase
MWSLEFQVMAGALVVLLFFHLFMFLRLAVRQTPVEPDHELPVSVVICSRNEARTLEVLLPVLLAQEHRTFEVVVVNDRSEDDTWEVLQWMKPQLPTTAAGEHPGRREVQLRQEDRVGCGCARAKYPHVLLTDADCLPDGPDWISTMAPGFRKGRSIVIGTARMRSSRALPTCWSGTTACMKAAQYMSASPWPGFPTWAWGATWATPARCSSTPRARQQAQPPDERR